MAENQHLAVCLTEFLAVYTADPKTGKLTPNLKVLADFSAQDPCLNQCFIRAGFIATGGDDCKVRVFKMKGRYEQVESSVELEGATAPVNSVCISPDTQKILAASKDANTYVFNQFQKKVIAKASFRCRPDQKNMIVRQCIFRDNDTFWTLCSQARDPTFLIKWKLPLGPNPKAV